MSIRFVIDPRCKYVYASYFIYGLRQLVGDERLIFDHRPFFDIVQDNLNEDFDQYFLFVDLKTGLKYAIDYRDKSSLSERALGWSDVYAKINLKYSDFQLQRLSTGARIKVKSIGPAFGINEYRTADLYLAALRNYVKSKRLKSPFTFREFLSGYNWARTRVSIKEYRPRPSDSNFVFHASRFYSMQSHGAETNLARANFIRAAKQLDAIVFEGGLYSNAGIPESFVDVRAKTYYPHHQYLALTSRSAFVFSCPAAWGCHGWKLGEFMAMGKAIISAPFENSLPTGMREAVNIHIVESLDNLSEEVNTLARDHEYRRHLENGAKNYYSEYLEPSALMGRLVIE